ncbi:hypothetical protein P7D22_06645 [Lichenihabitans sp. Uapishka_5]|nr:hypothetical protein [Lichenihabitans sp. Uapishka_5]MDX7950855.1 hypothetical protein [Lichenihabitans sp. Uapishka_5]
MLTMMAPDLDTKFATTLFGQPCCIVPAGHGIGVRIMLSVPSAQQINSSRIFEVRIARRILDRDDDDRLGITHVIKDAVAVPRAKNFAYSPTLLQSTAEGHVPDALQGVFDIEEPVSNRRRVRLQPEISENGVQIVLSAG